jgi:hypothetical protein
MADTLHSVLRQLPTALAFAAVLLAGWLVAKAVAVLLPKALRRVGFARLADRGGLTAALARSKYDASTLAGRLAYYGVLLVAAEIAFGLWGPNAVSGLLADVIRWLPRAFVAVVTLVVAAAIARTVKDVVAAALADLPYGRTLGNLARVTIVGLGGIAALNQIGVASSVTTPILITVLATVGGVIVVGVGGGLIRPMQERWAGWLDRAEEEAPAILEQARAYEAGCRAADAEMAMTVAAEQATMPLPDAAYAKEDVEKTVVIGPGTIPNE